MIEVRTAQGDLLSLPLQDPSGGYIIEEIDGLDPVKATIVSSSFAQLDGQQYHSSRREYRNIRIKISLEPDYTSTSVWDLRKRLYDFFMPKREINLRFYTSDNSLTVNIQGRVESCESLLFTQDPRVDISVLCFDPDFVDLEAIDISGFTTTENDEVLIDYAGTVESGIIFVLNANRTLTEFTLYHRPPDGTLRTLYFAGPLVAGDVLTISTVSGNKGATLKRGGTITSVLYYISPQSNWIQMDQGQNSIRVYTEGAEIPYTITYMPRYGGL
jgi:hypothetical protein